MNKNQQVIWADTPLVIVVGEMDVKGVRLLKAVWLDTDSLAPYLAEECQMPLDELIKLNSLETGDTARSNRWIVVWRN